ncbi:MAG: B12-binding domain-containing radical SAM protein [Bacteroidales bacterium]
MKNRNPKNIILLNPPGKKQYFRDYYCAKVSKARYYYHPVDLLYLSGRLAKTANVHFVDAIAEKMDSKKCLNQIIKIKPDTIISLSSAPSYAEDMGFINKIKNKLPDCLIIATGDIFREYRSRGLRENPQLDAILLDFSTHDILKYIENTDNKIIPNIIYRHAEQIIEGKEEHYSGTWHVPIPIWNKINLKAYHFPFAKRKPFASILTDFGCPYNCNFCPVSSLGFKMRPVNDVITELGILNNLGVKELYIRDQTFGVNNSRSIELLKAIKDSGMKFSWTCLSRTDVLSDELLHKMKNTGCHTVMLGIESANDALMKKHKKNIKLSDTFRNIKRIKKNGIRIGGFFMIGFPGENRSSVLETSKLARKLPLDYASFNIVSPRFGTEFRKESVINGIIDQESSLGAESSASNPVWKNQKLNNTQLSKLRHKAVRKFYLRPSYIIKRLASVKTKHEFFNLMAEGISLLKKSIP